MAASLDFSYHFLITPEELGSLERPFLYRGEVLHVSEGYLEERDWLWDRSGRLIATARQLIAMS
jgi:acyl-CoA thioesterase